MSRIQVGKLKSIHVRPALLRRLRAVGKSHPAFRGPETWHMRALIDRALEEWLAQMEKEIAA